MVDVHFTICNLVINFGTNLSWLVFLCVYTIVPVLLKHIHIINKTCASGLHILSELAGLHNNGEKRGTAVAMHANKQSKHAHVRVHNCNKHVRSEANFGGYSRVGCFGIWRRPPRRRRGRNHPLSLTPTGLHPSKGCLHC